MKKLFYIFIFFIPTIAFSQWTTISSGTTCLNSVCFPDANTGYIVGNFGTILKTVNSGLTWTALSCGTTRHLNSVCFINANTGFAVGDSGLILKTIN